MTNIDSKPAACDELSDQAKKLLRKFPPFFPNEPTRPQSIKLFITGVLFPLTCLIHVWLGWHAHHDAPWQSGNFQTYVGLLLDFPSILAFVPLMVYSMVCLTYWTFKPSSRRLLIVRSGNYLGAALSLQIFALILIVTGPVTLVAAAIVGPALAGLGYLTKSVVKHHRRFSIRHLLIVTTFVAVISAALRLAPDIRDALLISLFAIDFSIVAAAPTLTFITFFRICIALHSNPEMRFGTPTLLVTWIASGFAFIVSWRIALLMMMDEYSKLPTNNPNCYVSSAAAHGHPLLVRSEIIVGDSGQRLRINQQMRRLKFLELMLASSFPPFHRFVRTIYNGVGPLLASIIRSHPILADVAFMSLLPLEFAAGLLRRVCKIPKEKIDRFYRSSSSFMT